MVQDVELGVEWLEEAEEQGNADEQATLGRHYHETEDYVKSVLYWEKAAAQGHSAAQFGLGVCYGNGLGVERNPETSLDFILKAAEGGDETALQARAPAMQALFRHAISLTASSRLMRKLADLGHGPAEDMLRNGK